MATVVSIHSFRGGTGKSNTASNVAAHLATAGHRVAVVDTDIQSPGVHVLFGFDDAVAGTLNDFLWGERSITDVAHVASLMTEGLDAYQAEGVTIDDKAVIGPFVQTIAAHRESLLSKAAAAKALDDTHHIIYL